MPDLKTFTHTFVAASIAFSSMAWAQDASAALRVASWNVQIFGPQKAKKPAVMKIVVDTIKQYDLVLIQELKDVADDTQKALLKQVNDATHNAYDIIVSNRLGRTTAKEQYLYFYKKSALTVADSYQYANADDLFARPPFVVKFTTTQATVKNFFVVPLHAEPGAVPKEIGSLVNVYDDAVKRWGITNGVIMGDLAADCAYFTKNDRGTNPLRTDARFSWLIDDDTDTTTKDTDCAYDRIVVAGANLRAHVAKADVVNFQKMYELDTQHTQEVSDHYPIEFVIN